MSTTAADARLRREAPRVAARPRRRASTARATLILGAIGIALAGIVALNVAALRANMQAGDVQSETRRIEAENANLRAAIAEKRSGDRIAAWAPTAGMVLPPEGAVRTLAPLEARAG